MNSCFQAVEFLTTVSQECSLIVSIHCKVSYFPSLLESEDCIGLTYETTDFSLFRIWIFSSLHIFELKAQKETPCFF